ncbi:MAG: OST-HTH/LOTUS domain-containing protein [Suipraeoptans sp.]
MNNTIKLQKWKIAQKKHHLSDKQVQMARELGFNPDKLGKLDNHKQESWKAPLPQHIENLYFKRFNKEVPDQIKSIDQLLKEEKIKKEKQKKEKERKRKANLQEDKPVVEKPEIVKDIVEPISLNKKIKLLDAKPRTKVKLNSGDTPETILQKESHIFDEAFHFYEKEKVTLAELGFILKKIHPRYKPRRYGCKTLRAIYDKLPDYEVEQGEEIRVLYIIRKEKDAKAN